MDLYRKNLFISGVAVFIMGTITVGELLINTGWSTDVLKEIAQKVAMGVSGAGALFLGFVFLKGTNKKKAKKKQNGFFSHLYQGPKMQISDPRYRINK